MSLADYATAAYEFMSPTLLAKQPTTIEDKPQNNDEDWGIVFNHLESRLGMLRSWRWSWWAFWSVLAAFFLPFRYVWLVTANRMTRGSNLNTQIINSHGLLAVRTCAAGMWTGLCSPSRPWFKYTFGVPWDELDAETKKYIKAVEKIAYDVIAGSNFYNEMSQAFRDEVVFGQTPPIMYEDFEDVFRLYLPAAGEYYLGNGGRLSTNTLYREYTGTVLEIVDFFTLESCPQQVVRLWEQGGASLSQEFVIGHAIEPNFAISKRRKKTDKDDRVNVVPKGFAFREVYWLKGVKTDRPLSKKGFHNIPFMVFKWATVSNDPYARSPCMDAICDNKQVQVEDLRKGEFIEKGVRPPMGGNPELKNEPASIMPAQITYMDTAGGKKGFWPLFEVRAEWVKVLTDDVARIEARIDKCLFVDLFMAISRMEGVQPRNELELTKRDLERLQELGPVINLAEKEFDVFHERLLDIMERRRMLPPKPASLANQKIKVSYVSILRLAQQSAQSVAMKDCFTTGGQLSSAAKAAGVPDPIRTLKLDKAYKRYCEINNLDPDLFFTDDEVKQHDAIRTQEMQKAQAPQNAMAGVTAAKTLSETALPGGNSALGALMGQGGLQ